MSRNKPKVLVIDDDIELLDKIRITLSYSGITVKTFSNPYKAVDAFKTDKYDAVITDINIPEMNGLQVLKAVHNLDPSACVIILTGHPEEDVKESAMSSGAYAFLSKPLDIEELIQILSKIKLKNVSKKAKSNRIIETKI